MNECKQQGSETARPEPRTARPAIPGLDVIWDQPQPRYPAPERPPDRADRRSA